MQHTMKTHMLLRECVTKCRGTWLLVFLGTATAAASVTTGMQAGIWLVAVVWGFAVALTIYLTAHPRVLRLQGWVTKIQSAAYIAVQLVGMMLGGVRSV